MSPTTQDCPDLAELTSNPSFIDSTLVALDLPNARQKSTRCPFHEDASPSFSSWVGRDGRIRFKCHYGCLNGTIVDVVMVRRHCSQTEAIQWLRARYGGESLLKTGPYLARVPTPTLRFSEVYGRPFDRLDPFNDHDLERFNILRNANHRQAVGLATRRGILKAGDLHGRRAFFLSDREGRYAQAQPFEIPKGQEPTRGHPKGKQTFGQGLKNPLGLGFETPVFVLVWGNTDTIAAHEFITVAHKPSDVATLTLLGDGNRLSPRALEKMARIGCQVVILPDNDRSGFKAGEVAHKALIDANVPCVRFSWGALASLANPKGKPLVKDVGDLARCIMRAEKLRKAVRDDVLRARDWVLSAMRKGAIQ